MEEKIETLENEIEETKDENLETFEDSGDGILGGIVAVLGLTAVGGITAWAAKKNKSKIDEFRMKRLEKKREKIESKLEKLKEEQNESEEVEEPDKNK